MVSENINRLLIAFGNACLEMGKAYKPNNADELNAATQATMDTAGALRNAIASLESKLADAQARLAWILVSEGTKGLEILEDYLTTDESGEISKMKYCGVLRGVQKWLWSDNAFYHPTHWMPLPEPPEVK